jgi:large subunit ribosomal protein L7/L12
LIANILSDTGLAVKVPGNEGTTFLLHPISSITSPDLVDVVLESVGDNQARVIKVLRQIVSGLGIMEAKKLVESAPKPILEHVPQWVANSAKKNLEAVGAEITLKRSRADP